MPDSANPPAQPAAASPGVAPIAPTSYAADGGGYYAGGSLVAPAGAGAPAPAPTALTGLTPVDDSQEVSQANPRIANYRGRYAPSQMTDA